MGGVWSAVLPFVNNGTSGADEVAKKEKLNALKEASEMITEQYGKEADECAEAYFDYGVALIKVARADSLSLAQSVITLMEKISQKVSKFSLF